MLGMVQIAMLLALIRGGAALSFSQTIPIFRPSVQFNGPRHSVFSPLIS